MARVSKADRQSKKAWKTGWYPDDWSCLKKTAKWSKRELAQMEPVEVEEETEIWPRELWWSYGFDIPPCSCESCYYYGPVP